MEMCACPPGFVTAEINGYTKPGISASYSSCALSLRWHYPNRSPPLSSAAIRPLHTHPSCSLLSFFCLCKNQVYGSRHTSLLSACFLQAPRHIILFSRNARIQETDCRPFRTLFFPSIADLFHPYAHYCCPLKSYHRYSPVYKFFFLLLSNLLPETAKLLPRCFSGTYLIILPLPGKQIPVIR